MCRVRTCPAIVLGIALYALSPQTAAGAQPAPSSGGAVRGEVIDPQGQRIVGAAVALVLETGEVRETSSDARGDFRIDALPAGSHALTVGSPGFEPRTTAVDIGADVETDVSVVLDVAGMTARLTVTAPNPDGYDAPRAAAATRLNVPVIETPFSVQVVPLRVIEDQNALGLEEVYANVSGAYGRIPGQRSLSGLRLVPRRPRPRPDGVHAVADVPARRPERAVPRLLVLPGARAVRQRRAVRPRRRTTRPD